MRIFPYLHFVVLQTVVKHGSGYLNKKLWGPLPVHHFEFLLTPVCGLWQVASHDARESTAVGLKNVGRKFIEVDRLVARPIFRGYPAATWGMV